MPATWHTVRRIIMNWIKYFTLASASTIKFMFAPLAGLPMGLTFLETYLSCIIGAMITATVFFFGSDYFIKRAQHKREEKRKEYLQKKMEMPTKRNFTFMNKLTVKTRRSLGIYVICMFAPLFLSVPGGTIVSAKFYGHDKRAFPLILLGVAFNGLVITSLVYSSAEAVTTLQ